MIIKKNEETQIVYTIWVQDLLLSAQQVIWGIHKFVSTYEWTKICVLYYPLSISQATWHKL